MSTAIQNRSRGVSMNRPSRSSAAANATECTSRSSPPPNASPVSANTRATSSSERTSHSVTSFAPTDSASSRTPFSIRSPWKVNASSAPSSCRRFAIAQAIDRLLATPRISACLPFESSGHGDDPTATPSPSRWSPTGGRRLRYVGTRATNCSRHRSLVGDRRGDRAPARGAGLALRPRRTTRGSPSRPCRPDRR